MDYQTPPNPGMGVPPYPLTNKDLRNIGRRALSGRYGTMIGISLLLAVISSVISSVFSFISNQLYTLLSFAFHMHSDVLQYALTFILSFLASLLTCIFAVGSAKAYIQLLYGQPVQVGMLVHGFSHHPDRIILSNIPLLLISLVCSIPSTVYNTLYLEFANEYIENITDFMGGSAPIMPRIPENIMLWACLSLLGSILLIFLSLPFAMLDYLLVEMENVPPKDVIRTSFAMMNGHKGRYFCMNLSFIGWILLSVFFTCGIGLLWVIPYMEASLAAFYLDLKERYARNQQHL